MTMSMVLLMKVDEKWQQGLSQLNIIHACDVKKVLRLKTDCTSMLMDVGVMNAGKRQI